MEKILTSLMLITASFMLLFMVIPEPVHAVPHQEQFTIVKDADFDYNIELYNFLQYAYADYDDGVHPELLADIDVLTYSTSSVSKTLDVFTLTFDSYVIVVDNTTITSTGDAIADGTYVLDFYLEYETYQDLFYIPAVEFTVLTTDDTTWSATLTPGTFQILNDILYDNNIVESNINLTIDLWLNDVLMPAEIYYNSYPDNIALLIDGNFALSSIKNNDEVQSYYPIGSGGVLVTGDVVTLSQVQTLPWTQAHDYGRIRTNTSDLYLNESSAGTSVYLSHTSSVPSVINLSNIDLNDEIIMQSPYSTFEVSYGTVGNPPTVLVEQENIAAVKMIKHATDNSDYTFVLYYWENGSVTSRTVNHVDLANRNSLKIGFNGGYRKALDNQDAMVANVDELTPLEDFLPYLTAFDAIDGDISDDIVIVNDGGYQPDVVDIYNVEFGVTNSNGLESTVILPVHVVDIVAPVISGVNDPVQIGYHQEFNVAAWVASLSVSDNYYTGLTISIESNTYSNNKTEIGTYEIVVQSTDPSGQKGTLTRVIEVVDGIGPVFTGIETITASINEQLTAEQIKVGLAAVDAVDGNVTSSITIDSDALNGNNTIPGTYEIVFKAVDAAGNQTFHTVIVTIVASPPGFYILNSDSVRLMPGADLTIEQILNLLGASGATGISTNYAAGVTGVYNLSFSLEGVLYDVTVTVLGSDEPAIPEPIVPDETNFNMTMIYTIMSVLTLVGLGYLYFRKRK